MQKVSDGSHLGSSANDLQTNSVEDNKSILEKSDRQSNPDLQKLANDIAESASRVIDALFDKYKRTEQPTFNQTNLGTLLNENPRLRCISAHIAMLVSSKILAIKMIPVTPQELMNTVEFKIQVIAEATKVLAKNENISLETMNSLSITAMTIK